MYGSERSVKAVDLPLQQYIKPELLVLVLVLYLLGKGCKRSRWIQDEDIPLCLGLIGIVLALLWVVGTSAVMDVQQGCMALFTAVVQGILTAGASVYCHQLIKQSGCNARTRSKTHSAQSYK